MVKDSKKQLFPFSHFYVLGPSLTQCLPQYLDIRCCYWCSRKKTLRVWGFLQMLASQKTHFNLENPLDKIRYWIVGCSHLTFLKIRKFIAKKPSPERRLWKGSRETWNTQFSQFLEPFSIIYRAYPSESFYQ